MDMTLAVLVLSVLALGVCSSVHPRQLAGRDCRLICDEEAWGTPICGSDGHTYSSQCDFDRARCTAMTAGGHLSTQGHGECVTLQTPCEVASSAVCPSSLHPMLCGTDGRTYHGECIFRRTHCRSLSAGHMSTPVELAHTGSCESITNSSRLIDCQQYVEGDLGTIAIEGGTHLTLKMQKCSTVTVTPAPVCALDGRSYTSDCEFCYYLALTNQIAYDNMTIYTSHDGHCQTRHVIG